MLLPFLSLAITSLLTLTTASLLPPTINHSLQLQRPPVARANQSYSFTLLPTTFTSPNGSSINLSSSTLPRWATFDSITGSFSGTPLVGDVGSTTVQVTANVTGLTIGASDSFQLLVVNDPPPFIKSSVSSQLPNVVSLGGGAIIVAPLSLRVPLLWSFSLGFQQYTFADPSLSKIYYTAYESGTTGLPSWLNFDNETVTFGGVAPGQPISLEVEVWGSDRFRFGDVSQSFRLVVGDHYLGLGGVGALPGINGTAGSKVDYEIPISQVLLDNSTLSTTNLSSINVDLQSFPFLSYNSSTRSITGTIPSTHLATLPSIPITFKDIYNDTLSTNISFSILPSPSPPTPIPTHPSSLDHNSHHSLSHTGKLAIAITFSIIGGVLLLIAILAVCRRYFSSDEGMRRDQSSLAFSQSTIAAAQRSTGGTTFVSFFGAALGGKHSPDSPEKTPPNRGLGPAVSHVPHTPTTARSPRFRFSRLFSKTPSPRPSPSLPISYPSLFGLGIGDTPTRHILATHRPTDSIQSHRVHFGDDPFAASLPLSLSAEEVRNNGTNSWRSGSSSLVLSEGEEDGFERVRLPFQEPRRREVLIPVGVRGGRKAGSLVSETSSEEEGGVRLVGSPSALRRFGGY